MTSMLLALTFALAGAAVVAVGVRQRQAAAALGDPATYLHELDLDPGDDADEFARRMAEPFIARVLKPVSGGVLKAIAKLTPGDYVQRVHHRLLLAGMSHSVRAEEFVTVQVLATGFGLLAAMAWVAFSGPSSAKATLVLILLPGAGALVPPSWLSRKVQARQDAVRRDLPDVLDLLAISVEAGMGFEGALQVVCTHFDTPIAQEFSRALKEMELGLSRREALQNLKRRTEVHELSNFVLALTQADALGMPIGRVLHTQAAEMRVKRRQWAREKAGKLPVKILGPLVVFIFPAVLVVVVGPAFSAIMRGLGG